VTRAAVEIVPVAVISGLNDSASGASPSGEPESATFSTYVQAPTTANPAATQATASTNCSRRRTTDASSARIGSAKSAESFVPIARPTARPASGRSASRRPRTKYAAAAIGAATARSFCVDVACSATWLSVG
jgi:hypothetical protein